MCGIFGYVGSENAVDRALQGLKKLEYRGYDSAGIAGVKKGDLLFCKRVGRVSSLVKAVEESKLELDVAISHTRWATHGAVTEENAHPHCDSALNLAVVHNGIIENYQSLRVLLEEKGVSFQSDTDTEVVSQLIGNFYKGDLLKAVQEASALLKGSFAIAVVHKDYPDRIIAVAHESPLVIGIGKKEAFVSSDTQAFVAHTRKVVFLANAEIAVVQADKVEIFDSSSEPIDKETRHLTEEIEEVSKGTFAHYTLKEIFEQPQAIRNALLSRYSKEYGTATFEGLPLEREDLLAVKRILIVGCGTSLHAGYIGAYMIEEKARIPVEVEISSEFRYKNPIISEGTLVIAMSQSGETADTLAAVRELKAKGAKVLGICNVVASTLARDAGCMIFLRGGPEIGVCSTKTFNSQVVVLSLFTLLLARMHHMGKQEGQQFLEHLERLPEQVAAILENSSSIQKMAQKYVQYQNFFFLGRHYMFPTSLEGALKLKEISYINANGYPAGEMKHGPIALIDENCPTIALCANKLTLDKLFNNLKEVKARNGRILGIAEEGSAQIAEISDDVIWIPSVIDELAPVLATVVTQLFAYFVAKERGEDIDKPRNLAKSVTVE